MKVAVICVSVLIALAAYQSVSGNSNQGAAAEDDPGLMSIVLQGTQEASSSVTSGKGKLRVVTESRERDGGVIESDVSFTYLFRGDKFKFERQVKGSRTSSGSEPEPGYLIIPPDETDIVAFDGEMMRVLEASRGQGTVCDALSPRGRHELLQHDLILAIGRGRGMGNGVCDLESFRKALLYPGTTVIDPVIVGRETIDGDDCIVVEWRYEFTKATGETFRDTRRFWVNTDKGYTLKKFRSWRGDELSDSALALEYDVTATLYAGGIWGPEKVEESQYDFDSESGKRVRKLHRVATFDAAFELNAPVSDDELSLVFPSGMEVRDEVLNAHYTVP